MRKSIVVTVSVYACIQACLIAILSLPGSIPFREFLGFELFSAGLHAGLLFFLLRFQHYFTDQTTGLPFKRVNSASVLTLSRISCVPTVSFLLSYSDMSRMKVLLPVILAMVFLTDSFDGQIARRTHQITRIGQMLDSISDYGLLGVISVAYYRNDIVPTWFIVLIILRLFLQALGMLIFLLLKKPVETKSTWGGKIAIATTMSLYVVELARLYLPAALRPVFTGIEYAAGAIVFLSFFEKALIFFRHSKATKKPRG